MGSVKKYFVKYLSVYKTDKDKFEHLSEDLQNYLLEFLEVNRVIAAKNRFIRKATKQIKEDLIDIKRLKKRVTDLHPKIKSIPNGYSFSNLSVEKDRNSYRLIINWLGLKKKCSLGTDLRKIGKICREEYLNKEIKLNQKNFKEVIRASFLDILNDSLMQMGYDNFKHCKKIKFNYELKTFEIQLNEGVDYTKRDTISQSKKLGQNVNTPTSIKKTNRLKNSYGWVPFPNLHHALDKD
jgi:hypothetical protein